MSLEKVWVLVREEGEGVGDRGWLEDNIVMKVVNQKVNDFATMYVHMSYCNGCVDAHNTGGMPRVLNQGLVNCINR